MMHIHTANSKTCRVVRNADPQAEIMQVYADKKYTCCQMIGSEQEWFVTSNASLRSLSQAGGKLHSDHGFLLVSRERLVNVRFIDRLEREETGRVVKLSVVLVDGKTYPVTTRESKLLKVLDQAVQRVAE